jgi:hypothetical protein
MSSSSLTLYATRAGFGLPDTSPFVIKVEVQLKMAGLAYDRASAIPPQAPNGKLPFINDHDEVLSDSTFIRAHVERKYGVDLDEGLDARQRAESWAIERMLEDHLYFAMVWFRWIDPENFAKGPAHFADGAPEADRAQLRQDLQARKAVELRAQGLGRHTPAHIAALGERSIDALAQLLDDKPLSDGRRTQWRGRHRLRHARLCHDTVLRHAAAPCGGDTSEPRRLCRAHDATLLPRTCVGCSTARSTALIGFSGFAEAKRSRNARPFLG